MSGKKGEILWNHLGTPIIPIIEKAQKGQLKPFEGVRHIEAGEDKGLTMGKDSGNELVPTVVDPDAPTNPKQKTKRGRNLTEAVGGTVLKRAPSGDTAAWPGVCGAWVWKKVS